MLNMVVEIMDMMKFPFTTFQTGTLEPHTPCGLSLRTG